MMTLSSRQLGTFVAASMGLHILVLILWRSPSSIPLPEPPRLLLFDIQALAPEAAAPPVPVVPPVPPEPAAPKLMTPEPLPEVSEVTEVTEVESPPLPDPLLRERSKPVPEVETKPAPKAEPKLVPELEKEPGADSPSPTPPSIAPKADPVVKARYEQQLFAWLNRQKKYPLVARRRGLQGTTVMRIKVDRNGRVLFSALEAKSGYSILNDEALAMVNRADPFPPIPENHAGSSFEFTARVEFALR